TKFIPVNVIVTVEPGVPWVGLKAINDGADGFACEKARPQSAKLAAKATGSRQLGFRKTMLRPTPRFLLRVLRPHIRRYVCGPRSLSTAPVAACCADQSSK